MTSLRVSACIVGGGPAGLMLGLLLAKRGAEVLVLEGHEDFEREFRGEVLQPSTSHLLDELGLLEYVRAQPHSLLRPARSASTAKRSASSRSRRSRPSIRTPSGCRSRSSCPRSCARPSRCRASA